MRTSSLFFVFLPCFALGCSSGSPSNGDVAEGGAGDDGGAVTPGSPDATSPVGDGSASTGGKDGATGPVGDGSTGGHKDGGAPTPPPPTGVDAGPITGLTGTTYYVAPGGSDSNPGTSASPWKTIQQAGAVVKAGDTVLVRAGTYDGAVFGWDSAPCTKDVYCAVVGTSTNPILFEADPAAAAGSVIIASKNAKTKIGFDLEPGCNYVHVVGFTVTNAGTPGTAAGSITKAGIAVAKSTGNRVLNNTVDGVTGIGGIFVDSVTDVLIEGNTTINIQGTGTTGHGMYVSGSSAGVQVVENRMHDNAYIGLHVNGDVSEGLPGVVKNILVEGNLIYKNGQNGINADGIQSSTFVNNVIYGNSRHGIELYQIDAFGGSTGNVIVNNTIDQSASSGGYAISVSSCQYDNQSSQPTPAGCSTSSADTSTGNVAFNNVLLGGAGATGTVSSADLSTSSNLTSITGLFVGAATGNYTLLPAGPGAGAGVGSFGGASAPVAPGGGYDIGAFSFVQ
ncbi:MAG TPA: right-handed parallel beta-helix repeat-containing protein [Polyangiaceae bacterium]